MQKVVYIDMTQEIPGATATMKTSSPVYYAILSRHRLVWNPYTGRRLGPRLGGVTGGKGNEQKAKGKNQSSSMCLPYPHGATQRPRACVMQRVQAV